MCVWYIIHDYRIIPLLDKNSLIKNSSIAQLLPRVYNNIQWEKKKRHRASKESELRFIFQAMTGVRFQAPYIRFRSFDRQIRRYIDIPHEKQAYNALNKAIQLETENIRTKGCSTKGFALGCSCDPRRLQYYTYIYMYTTARRQILRVCCARACDLCKSIKRGTICVMAARSRALKRSQGFSRSDKSSALQKTKLMD